MGADRADATDRADTTDRADATDGADVMFLSFRLKMGSRRVLGGSLERLGALPRGHVASR